MIKFKKTILAFLMLLGAMTFGAQKLNAVSFSGGFNSSVVKNLPYYNASGKSYLSTAANNWNGISSMVKSASASDYHSRVYLAESLSGASGVLGRIVPYKSSCYWPIDPSHRLNCFSVANTYETWDYVYLYVYTNNATSSTSKKYTAVHEYGHVLSQSHNYENSVMRQGIYALTSPTTYDINSLKSRWGN